MRRQHTRNVLRSICLVGLCLAGGGVASAGTPTSALDPEFGGTGLVLTDFTGGEDGANAVAVDQDGNVVAAGFGDLGDPERPHVAGFGLARYLPNGSPDPGFSGDGRTLVDFSFVNQAAASMAIDSQGRILTVGTITTFDGSTSSIGVARSLTGGAPDPDFGTGADGQVVVQPGVLSSASDVAVDSQDRVVVIGAATGSKGYRPIVLRFTADGELDDSFGSGGIAEFGRVARDFYTAVAVDRRGRLLLGGASRPQGTDRGVPAVRRMSSSGVLDGDYGTGSLGFARPLGSLESEVADLTIDGQGRPVVVATCGCGPSGDDDFAAGRLTARGRADRSFSHDGRAYIRFGSMDARPSSIAVDPADRVIIGGSVRIGGDNDWGLARLRPNGKPDSGFADGGTITAQVGAGVEGIQGVAVDDDSRVIAAGLGLGPSGSDFAVARFR